MNATATPSVPSTATQTIAQDVPKSTSGVVYESYVDEIKVDDRPRTILGTGLTLLQLLALIAAFYATMMFQIPSLPVGEKWVVQVQTGTQILFGVVVYVIANKLLNSLIGK